MYKLLLKSLGNLIAGLSETNEIQPERAAESYDFYMAALNSRYHYASRYRKWDVCWIQWGNNLKPEMSYKHMGIVFKVDNKMAYAFPITSISQNQRLQDAYHPVDNPDGNKIFYRMNAADFSFLAHDSAIKLRELKCISIKRIVSKCGSIVTNSLLTTNLTNFMLDYLFHEKANEIGRLKKQNSLLKMEIEASKISGVYPIKDITDLNHLIEIDTTIYKLIIGTPVLKCSTQYEVVITLTDEYNQEIHKSIKCNVKEEC